ncbi:MAG: hypothetical protein CM1200mP38_0520 [Dehalococcoidia bacterium]|nr:MAG: hypothetical protein CM1200mP38_0520 [Dehalococcoidia bacterium]
MDPDELIRKNPIEGEKILEQEKPLYLIYNRCTRIQINLDSSDGKTQALEIMRPIIQKAPFLEKGWYINKLSTLLGNLIHKKFPCWHFPTQKPPQKYIPKNLKNSINSSQSQEIRKNLSDQTKDP